MLFHTILKNSGEKMLFSLLHLSWGIPNPFKLYASLLPLLLVIYYLNYYDEHFFLVLCTNHLFILIPPLGCSIVMLPGNISAQGFAGLVPSVMLAT